MAWTNKNFLQGCIAENAISKTFLIKKMNEYMNKFIFAGSLRTNRITNQLNLCPIVRGVDAIQYHRDNSIRHDLSLECCNNHQVSYNALDNLLKATLLYYSYHTSKKELLLRVFRS